MRYADPTRCPDCRTPLPSAVPSTCPSCALPLLGREPADLFRTLQRADDQLAALRLRAAQAPTAAAQPGAVPPAPAPLYSPLPPRRSPLTGASVPQILLGLGAVCVLVAAVVFLALAWSWLGIGGRTAVLVALTAAAGAASVFLTRRGLRIGGEAFAVIATGLVALDLAGAADAGWLGPLDDAGTAVACALGAAAAAVGLVLATRPAALVAPQILGPLAVVVGSLAAQEAWAHSGLAGLVFALVLLGLSASAGRLSLPILRWDALGAAVVPWLALLAAGLDGELDARHLWLRAEVWPVLAAGGLLAGVAWLLPRGTGRLIAWSGAGVVLTLAVVLASLDEPANRLVLALLCAALGWSLVLLLAPGPVRRVAAAPAALFLLSPILMALETAVIVAFQLIDAQDPASTGSPGFTVLDPWFVPATAAVLVLLVAGLSRLLPVGSAGVTAGGTPRPPARRLSVLEAGWPGAAAFVLLSITVAVAAQDVPRWTLAVPLALVAVALVVRPGRLPGAVPAVVLGLAALLVAHPSVLVTAIVLAMLVVAAAVALTSADPVAVLLAEGALPVTVGALVWTLGDLASVDVAWRGLPVVVAVAALAWWRPRLVLEVSAAAVAVIASVVALGVAEGDLTDLAIHLTLLGAALVVHALLHAERRPVAWAGGLLLAAATWCRLADLGVEQPEAYTLPTALVLVALGLWRMRRDPHATTTFALAPGLTLATVPSLLWVLDDPVSLRAVLLGAACLALTVGGALLRWSAPLLVGAGVGLVLVLREVQPYAAHLPPWVLIGFAGATLITVGLTWEARMRDLRRGASYLTALR